MPDGKLTNAPLIEAIFEARWQLPGGQNEVPADPGYKLLVGRLYDRFVAQGYKVHEPLPISSMPDEMTPYMVHHRFRVAEEAWPLVQVGPGVVTANDIKPTYTWADFKPRCEKLITDLYQVRPLGLSRLQLRYINAIPFPYRRDDVFDFMNKHLRTVITPAPSLFDNMPIGRLASDFALRLGFPTQDPLGSLQVSFALGKSDGEDALLWENVILSVGEQIPDIPTGFSTWLDHAHQIAETTFLHLTEGKLLESFR